MKKTFIILLLALVTSSFGLQRDDAYYSGFYKTTLAALGKEQQNVVATIQHSDITTDAGKRTIKEAIAAARLRLKTADFWLRYLEPIAYKKVNGPLPVEWENEVFEKFEKPYKREGAGLSLAELYLDSRGATKDSLLHLVQLSQAAMATYSADSITRQLDTFDHFYLCNRLYLLNLAALYTTGFECPGRERVIPELRAMLAGVKDIYQHYNYRFPATPLPAAYLALYDKAIAFAAAQPGDFAQFDHYTFIKDHVNPLFALNQQLIRQYGVASGSYNDYTLSNDCSSIFDKELYTPQNIKGIYSLITDTATLGEVRRMGKLLFYDPILSGNNRRSCASCHKPSQYFTDTTMATNLQFDEKQHLARNTPSLINVVYNHLLMLDGKHTSLQSQGKDVMTNATEMSGAAERDIMEKVLSCKEYKNTFRQLLRLTPEEHEITFEHIISAVTYYYGGFSSYYSPFDEAMNSGKPLGNDEVSGFNLFMGKAQCGTCHYVPQFNGVPPPYIGSEFEVIGVPADKAYTRLSDDNGRYMQHEAGETRNAFRTGTVRNAAHTMPYMHNGVFNTLEEVVDFYDAGGGAGNKLAITNQTLAADSLRLTGIEKKQLISFIRSLSEHVIFEAPPAQLPASATRALNARKVGGEY